MLVGKDSINNILAVLSKKLYHPWLGIFTFWWKCLLSLFLKDGWSPPLGNIPVYRSFVQGTLLGPISAREKVW